MVSGESSVGGQLASGNFPILPSLLSLFDSHCPSAVNYFRLMCTVQSQQLTGFKVLEWANVNWQEPVLGTVPLILYGSVTLNWGVTHGGICCFQCPFTPERSLGNLCSARISRTSFQMHWLCDLLWVSIDLYGQPRCRQQTQCICLHSITQYLCTMRSG